MSFHKMDTTFSAFPLTVSSCYDNIIGEHGNVFTNERMRAYAKHEKGQVYACPFSVRIM